MPVRRLPPAAAPPRRHVAGLPPFHQHSQPPTLAHGIIRRPRILRVLPPAAHTPLPLARCLQPQQHPAARRVISACRCLLPTTHSALRIHIQRPFCGPFPAHCTLLHAPPDTRPHLVRWMDPQRVGCSPLAATCGRNRALTLPHPHVAGRHRTLPTEPPHRYAARIHVSRRCRCHEGV